MKLDLQPLIDAFLKLVDRVGSKCAVALGALGFLGYSIYAAKVPPLIGVIGMVVVALGYFLFDHLKQKEGECTCEEVTTDSSTADNPTG